MGFMHRMRWLRYSTLSSLLRYSRLNVLSVDLVDLGERRVCIGHGHFVVIMMDIKYVYICGCVEMVIWPERSDHDHDRLGRVSRGTSVGFKRRSVSFGSI